MALRICFVVGEERPNHCGVKDYSVRLAAALARIGIAAVVSASPSWGTGASLSFFRRLRQMNYDIVHIQYPSIGFKWSLWPHCAGCLTSYKKSVVTIHEYSGLPSLQRFSTHLFRWTAAQMLFTTEFEAGRFRKDFARLGAPQQIVPIGSNVPKYPVDVARDLNVIYFGQIRPDRGIEEFIALARLSFGLSRPFGFLVVGSVPRKHSEYYRMIRTEAPSRVQWLIDLESDDVAKVMASSLAAYLPFPDGASYRRGSMLAAMTNGLPVITRIGAATAPDLLESVMIAAQPGEALAQLESIYASPEYGHAKASHARTLVRGFSWEEIARQHADIYDVMLSEPPTTG
jgi:glycosyltransferase involved in cell wall biosynthesis